MRNHIMLGLLAVAGAANAIVIDDFSTGEYHKSITELESHQPQAGSMLGGYRATQMQVISNTFGLELSTDIVGGAYTLSAQSGVDGTGRVGYGFTDVGGVVVAQNLNANLSADSAFKLNFLSSDLPGTYTIAVRSSNGINGDYVSYTGNFEGNSVNTPFSKTIEFSQFAGMNFSDVDQILVTIDSGLSGDVSLSSIETVPEPASMAILAVAGAFIARRRKKN